MMYVQYTGNMLIIGNMYFVLLELNSIVIYNY